MKQLTLLFLRREGEVLLAMKKRGFGEGKWNGVGGKVEPDETIEQGVKREAREEIGVTPTIYEKVGEVSFNEFHQGQPVTHFAHVFVASKWHGEPAESEEMAPQWFALDEIPYDNMWADDPYWLPRVLAGKKIQADFELDEDDKITAHSVREVDGFEA